jgi:hypothetical protein
VGAWWVSVAAVHAAQARAGVVNGRSNKHHLA